MTTITDPIQDEITDELEQRKAELEAAAAEKRARQTKFDQLTNAVHVAERHLQLFSGHVDAAVSRVPALQETILTLATRTGADAVAQMLACYSSIAVCESLIADADRVEAVLQDRLNDATITLKNFQK